MGQGFPQELQKKFYNELGVISKQTYKNAYLGIGNEYETYILLDGSKRGNGRAIGFFCFRGYRMNYWGVTGLLARVHSYNRENDKAYVYAN